MRYFKLLLMHVAPVFVALMTITSCKGPCEKLEKVIGMNLVDSVFTATEYNDLLKFISDNENELTQCYPSLEGDANRKMALLDIIKSNESYSTGKVLEFEDNAPLVFSTDIYLETSFSMYGYDGRTLIDFKNVLRSVVNSLQSREPGIYIVNKDVMPADLSYNSLVSTNNIFNLTARYGDPSFTDFKLIFSEILRRSNDSTVAVLVSDMIVSSENSKTSAHAISMDSELTMEDVFRSYSQDNDVLVLKFLGDFDGIYYPYNNPKGVKFAGQRPFYVTIIARKEIMKKILHAHEFERFYTWKRHGKFESYQYFSRIDRPLEPRYSIVVDDRKAGEYTMETAELTSGDNTIHALKKVATRGDSLEIPVNVDFSEFYLSDTLIENKANYDVSGDFEVKEVKLLDREPGYTHQLIIKYKDTKFLHDQRVVVSLKKNINVSLWVEESDSVDDTDTHAMNFSNTTFGIGSMLRGINNAYSSSNKYYYQLSINLKK